MEKRVGGNVNWSRLYGEQCGDTKLKIELPYDPEIPFLTIYPEKTIIQKHVFPTFTAALFTVVRTCSLTEEWIMMWYICTMGYHSAMKRMK